MAYPVSNDFKTKLYSGESNFRAILTINGTTIPEEQIASISISSPIIDNTNSMFYMGSFISQKITIHFNNMEGINVASGQEVSLTIGQYVNNAWEDVPIGVFLVDDLSEDYYQKCEINCLDYAIKFKPNIDYSPCFTDGKATIDTILAYICNYFNVTLGEYPSINGDVEIGTYDASISGKQWISYIAEIKGCNAKMDRTGALTLKPIKSTSVETIDATSGSELTLGEAYNISKVCYYDAIRKYEYGNDSGNTLYIRQDNPFINESVVVNLYEQVLTQPSSSEDTNFELSGLSSLPISVAEIEGETYQEQIEASRNILRIANTNSYVSNGITSTYNNSEVTISGTATSNFAYLCDYNDNELAIGTYTFSKDQQGDPFVVRINVKYEDNSTGTFSIGASGIKKTFTTSKKIISYRLSIGSITSGSSYNVTMKLQLETGSTYTDWVEPKDASPSPGNPSEVEVVTGDNEVEIIGKNLLDFSNPLGKSSGLTYTFDNDTITASGTGTYTQAYFDILELYKKSSGKTLTFSVESYDTSGFVSSSTTIVQLQIQYNDGTATKWIGLFASNGRIYTHEIPNDTSNVSLVRLQIYANNSGTSTTSSITLVKPMLIYSDTPSGYEPYTSQNYPLYLGVENLLDLKNGTYTNNGVTAVVTNGQVLLNGTPTSGSSFITIQLNKNINWVNGKDHTIMINNNISIGTENTYGAVRIDLNGTLDTKFNIANNYKVINIDVSNVYNDNIQIRTGYGITYNNYVIEPKIIVASKPNYISDTPIELCKINNYKDRIFKTSGKNLFDGEYVNSYIGGDSGYLYNYNSSTRTAIIKSKPNTTYTIKKYQNTGFGTRFTISEYPTLLTQSTEMGANSRLFINPNVTQATVTTSSVGEYLYIYVTNDTSNIPKLMVEEGSIASDFEPYGSGKWYLNKNVGKYNITGNEQWTLYDITEKPVYYIDTTIDTQKIDYAQQLGTLCYCDYLKGGQQVANFNDVYDMGNYSIAFRTTYKRLVIRYDTTLSNLTTWLSSAKPFVLYPLATPTYTEITNTELLEQLENIQNISPYNGYANISITTSNLTPTLKLNYTTSDNLDLQSLTTRNIGDFSLDAWDTITYDVDGTTYKALNNNEITYEQSIMGVVNPKFPTGQQEETTNVVEESVNSLKLKVSTEIDNVNGAIALKVDKDDVINSINLSTEGTQIEGGKISLAGKTIEMTSDDITINSNNFQVDAEGNVNCTSSTMTNSTINGGKLSLYDIGQNDPSIEIYENEREDSLTIGNTYDLYSVVLNTLSSGIYSGNDRIARNGTIVAFTTNEYLYKYVLTCRITYSPVFGQTYQEVIYEYKSNLADTQTLQMKRIWFYSETMSISQQLGIDQKNPTIINENVTCTIYDTSYSIVLNKMHYDMTTNNLQTKIASDYILGRDLMLQDSGTQNYFFMVTPTTGQIMTNCLAQFDDIILTNSTNEIRITPSDIKKNNKSIINKSNITMGLASNVTISNTTETKISLSAISYTGSGLTATSDGGVLIGSGIIAVSVNAQAYISAFSGNALRTLFIKRYRNGELSNIARAGLRLNTTYTGTYNTMQITSKITGVQEGDIIYLYAQHQNPSSGTSSTTIYGSGIDTYLTVQELE